MNDRYIPLLKNPDSYTIETYKGTNHVFRAQYISQNPETGDPEPQDLIVKKPKSLIGGLPHIWYTFCDSFFYGGRSLLSTSHARLEREASTLEAIAGDGAPELVNFDGRVLIREYIDGQDFRSLGRILQGTTLEKGFDLMQRWHNQGIVIGDPHPKNLVLTFEGDSYNGAYWIDFDGVFPAKDETHAKALDVLRFVFMTYPATRDEGLTRYAAELASTHTDHEVKERVAEMVTPGLSTPWIFLPTRFPLNGKLNKRVKEILRSGP